MWSSLHVGFFPYTAVCTVCLLTAAFLLSFSLSASLTDSLVSFMKTASLIDPYSPFLLLISPSHAPLSCSSCTYECRLKVSFAGCMKAVKCNVTMFGTSALLQQAFRLLVSHYKTEFSHCAEQVVMERYRENKGSESGY